MLRKVLIAVGLIEIAIPERFIESAERVALEDPDGCERKSWVVPAGRLEGVLFLAIASRGSVSYTAFKKLLGVIGLVASAYPTAFVDLASGIAYVDPERCTWRSWCYSLTRLLGVVYVAIAVRELWGEGSAT